MEGRVARTRARGPDPRARALARLCFRAFGVALMAGAPPAMAAEVRILSPRPGEVVHGVVEVQAEVAGAEIVRMEFLVNGRRAGELARPPWRLAVDLGGDNVEHDIAVVAFTTDGGRWHAQVRTGRIPVHEEVTVTLQQVYLTATVGGRRILDLRREEVELSEDGRRQAIVTFTRGEVPFTAVILVDASLSMSGEKLGAARAGVHAFAAGMRPLDEARAVVFADGIRAATPFSTFPEVLLAALAGVHAGGGTALNDALRVALAQLEPRQGRRVVVLLSDGVDSHSVLRMRQVLPALQRSRAQLYWFNLEASRARDGATLRSPWRTAVEHQEELRLLVEAVAFSGGRVIPAGSAEAITKGFAELLGELRDQYVLGYYPPARRGDGSFRRIEVRATRPGVQIRTAAGYVDL